MATATLRPDSTVASSGVSIQPSGTAHGVTSDNSDSTRVLFNDAGDSAELGFGDFSPPAGSLVTRVALRLRTLRLPLSGTTALVAVLKIAGEEHVASQTITWYSLSTTTFITLDGSFSEAEVDAATVELSLYAGDAEVYEAYLDITYVTTPVATITAPTGTVTTDDTPTVRWTATLDPAGGPQAHFRAVIMANGEHPDIHTPVADSGIVNSSASEWTPPDPIPNGTYDFYVKVAQ